MKVIVDIVYRNGPNYSADYYRTLKISESDLIPFVQSKLNEELLSSPGVKSVEIVRIEK